MPASAAGPQLDHNFIRSLRKNKSRKMLAAIVVLFGVLALTFTTTSFFIASPPRCTGWQKNCVMINPTVPSVRPPIQRTPVQKPQNQASSWKSKDNVVRDSFEKKALSTLKTGTRLDGIVVSSTPYAAFINAGKLTRCFQNS